MSARREVGFGERLERAIRTSDRGDSPRKETPEAFGRRLADELFSKAVRTVEADRRQD